MGRDLVAQRALFARLAGLHLLAKHADFLHERVDLLLLAKNGGIQGFDRVFGEGKLDFEFGDARFERAVIGRQGLFRFQGLSRRH